MTYTRTFDTTELLLREVHEERRRQVVDLGYSPEHDDDHGSDTLVARAYEILGYGLDNNNRDHLIKGLALMVAGVESYDRVSGHE